VLAFIEAKQTRVTGLCKIICQHARSSESL